MEPIIVADIMTRDPISIKPETNLLECAKKIVKKRVGSLLLVNNKKLLGIISERDILWALVKKSKKDLSMIKAVDIAPKKIITIKPSSTIKEAISKIKKFKLKRLPVVLEKKLVGLITVKDILSFNPEFYPELEEIAKIREESKKLKRIKAKEVREGVCEECGNHDLLYKFNGKLICENCMDSM